MTYPTFISIIVGVAIVSLVIGAGAVTFISQSNISVDPSEPLVTTSPLIQPPAALVSPSLTNAPPSSVRKTTPTSVPASVAPSIAQEIISVCAGGQTPAEAKRCAELCEQHGWPEACQVE